MLRNNFHDANENCKTQFGKGVEGRLFEPKDSETDNLVMRVAFARLDSDYAWLGIHDITSEGNFSYNSGGALEYTNWIRILPTELPSCVKLNIDLLPTNCGSWNIYRTND